MKHTHLPIPTALVALGLVAAPIAHAQTVLTGHHDNNAAGDGYVAGGGSYRVPTDTGTAQDATFNGNSHYGYLGYSTVSVQGGQFNNNLDGIYAYDSATVTVSGGQFRNNTYEGIYAYNAPALTISGGIFTGNDDAVAIRTGSSATISGGTFSNNLTNGFFAFDRATATVSGGTFTNNGSAGLATDTNAVLTVTGGIYSGNAYDFYCAGGTIYLDGQFNGMTPGQTRSLSAGLTPVTGTLQRNTAAGTYSAYVNGGSIILRDVAAPEPSVWASLTVGALGLAGLSVFARRRPQI